VSIALISGPELASNSFDSSASEKSDSELCGEMEKFYSITIDHDRLGSAAEREAASSIAIDSHRVAKLRRNDSAFRYSFYKF